MERNEIGIIDWTVNRQCLQTASPDSTTRQWLLNDGTARARIQNTIIIFFLPLVITDNRYVCLSGVFAAFHFTFAKLDSWQHKLAYWHFEHHRHLHYFTLFRYISVVVWGGKNDDETKYWPGTGHTQGRVTSHRRHNATTVRYVNEKLSNRTYWRTLQKKKKNEPRNLRNEAGRENCGRTRFHRLKKIERRFRFCN